MDISILNIIYLLHSTPGMYGAILLNREEGKFECVNLTEAEYKEIKEKWNKLPSEIEYKRQEVIKNGK